jgi:hypothetical protein
MVELHQEWCHEPFIAIAACAILVYIVYAYNKCVLTATTVYYGTRRKRYAPSHGRRCRKHISLWTILVFNPRGTYRLFPQDRLTASDLLPKDAAVSSGHRQILQGMEGDVQDQNYLTAGFMEAALSAHLNS